MKSPESNSLFTLSFKKVNRDYYQTKKIEAENLNILIAKRAMAIVDQTGLCPKDGEYVFTIMCDDINDPDEIGFEIEMISANANSAVTNTHADPIPEDVSDKIGEEHLEGLFTTMEPISDFIERLRATFSDNALSLGDDDKDDD